MDPTGKFLALGGSSKTGADHFVLDAQTGEVEAEANVAHMVTRALVATKRSVRIEALAFHPAGGGLAAATNAGVVVELHPGGEASAFRAAARAITCLAFADDGRSLIEPQLRVWPIDLA